MIMKKFSFDTDKFIKVNIKKNINDISTIYNKYIFITNRKFNDKIF